MSDVLKLRRPARVSTTETTQVSSPKRVWGLTASLALLAIATTALLAQRDVSSTTLGLLVPFATIGLAVFLLELQAASITAAKGHRYLRGSVEVPVIATIVWTHAWTLSICAGLGMLLAMWWLRRSFVKTAFNVSGYAAATGTATLLAELWHNEASPLLGLVAFVLVNALSLTAVISISTGQSWRSQLPAGADMASFAFAWGILGYGAADLLARANPLFFLTPLPIAGIFLLERARTRRATYRAVTTSLVAAGLSGPRTADEAVEVALAVIADTFGQTSEVTAIVADNGTTVRYQKAAGSVASRESQSTDLFAEEWVRRTRERGRLSGPVAADRWRSSAVVGWDTEREGRGGVAIMVEYHRADGRDPDSDAVAMQTAAGQVREWLTGLREADLLDDLRASLRDQPVTAEDLGRGVISVQRVLARLESFADQADAWTTGKPPDARALRDYTRAVRQEIAAASDALHSSVSALAASSGVDLVSAAMPEEGTVPIGDAPTAAAAWTVVVPEQTDAEAEAEAAR